MDRSVKSLLSIILVVAAVFVAMNRVVENARIEDWWLVAVLLGLAVLIYVWDSLGRGGSSVDTQVEAGQSSLDGFRQAVAPTTPAAVIAPKVMTDAEQDHADIVKAYGEIRDTDLRSDGMASSSTTDTQEARAIQGMVQNVTGFGATGTFEEVDEIAGGPVGSNERVKAAAATPPAATPPAPPKPVAKTTKPAPTAKTSPAPSISVDQAKAAPVSDKPDDLTVIEGIGAKMDAALKTAGIDTFARLSSTSEADIRAAIGAAGMRFAPSVPTWPQQASLAAKGDWSALKEYQQTLKAGRKK